MFHAKVGKGGINRGNVGKVRKQFDFYEMCIGASRYTGCPASG